MDQSATLQGQQYPSRTKPLFWKIEANWPAKKNKPDHWVSYAVVEENWKLVANNNLSYVELYDISSDVYEKNDLKDSKPDIADHLVAQIEEWKETLPEKPDPKLFSAERKRM